MSKIVRNGSSRDKESNDDVKKHHSRHNHKRIEHRFISYCAATAILGTGIIGGYLHSDHISYVTAMTTTNYGQPLSFSKTSSPQLEVHRPISNHDRTLVYIPITISNNNQQLSTDANHYSLLVRPTVNNLGYKLKANYIIFGNTGDALIRLQSDRPMQPNTLMILLRNNDNLRNAGNNAELNNNNSNNNNNMKIANTNINLANLANKYDIVEFSVNPAAKNITVNNKIDDANTGSKLYRLIYGNDQIDRIQKKINQDQKHIKADLKLATELTTQLTNEGYQVPNPPAYTKDDWRPYNTVNPQTGDLKNGGNVLSVDTNSQNTANNNPDNQTFPTTLPNNKYGNNAMQNQSNNGNGNDQNSPITLWQNLQSTWQDILTTKQDIYVTQNKRIFMINNSINQQDTAYSVQSNKHVTVVDRKLQ